MMNQGSPTNKLTSTFGTMRPKTAEVTPGKLRINQLYEKLGNVPTKDQKSNRYSRRIAFEQRLRTIEEKIRKSYQNDEANFKIFKDKVSRIGESLKSQVNGREILEQAKEKEVKVLENNFGMQLSLEKQSRREFESDFIREFDDKMGRLRLEMVDERKENDSKISNMLNNVSDELSLIQGELFAERRAREETYDKIIKKLGGDVLRLNDILNSEKKVREDNHELLIKMLGETREKLIMGVQNEKRLREQNQEFLFKLLDQTVAKVQTTLNP